jgi:hypothetical protein
MRRGLLHPLDQLFSELAHGFLFFSTDASSRTARFPPTNRPA